MNPRTLFFLLAASTLVIAGPATAASACLGVVCTQGIVDTYPTIWAYGNVEVCEGNIQVGVAGGEQMSCQRQMYACGADDQLNIECGRPGSGGPTGPPGSGGVGSLIDGSSSTRGSTGSPFGVHVLY